MFSCSTSTASGHSHLCPPSSFHIHTNTHTPLLFSSLWTPSSTAIYLIYGRGECVTHTHVCIIYHMCERTVCERTSVWHYILASIVLTTNPSSMLPQILLCVCVCVCSVNVQSSMYHSTRSDSTDTVWEKKGSVCVCGCVKGQLFLGLTSTCGQNTRCLIR